MVEEMRADFVSQGLALSRDPLADPELAPYLVRGIPQCSIVHRSRSVLAVPNSGPNIFSLYLNVGKSHLLSLLYGKCAS